MKIRRKTFDLIGIFMASVSMAVGQVGGIRINGFLFFLSSFTAVFYSKRACDIELREFRSKYVLIKEGYFSKVTPPIFFLFWWIPYSILTSMAIDLIRNDILLYLAIFIISFIELLILSTYTINKMYKEIDENTSYYLKDYYKAK